MRPGLAVDFVESYHDHPGLIEAFRERAEAALLAAQQETGGPVPVIFTAHSVPERTIAEGDPYEQQVRETAASGGQGNGPHRIPRGLPKPGDDGGEMDWADGGIANR